MNFGALFLVNGGADADVAAQYFMHRASSGYLLQTLFLFSGKLAFKVKLGFYDRGIFIYTIKALADLYFINDPHFAVDIHLQGDRGAAAQAG